jgi:hypothetical protein
MRFPRSLRPPDGLRVGLRAGSAAFDAPMRTAILLGLLLSAACASRPAARHFLPASEEQAARSLAAWKTAVARADAAGSSRVLYDAKIRQGIASVSGTLALVTSPPVRGTLSGPFGSTLAEYSDGALQGEKLQRIEIEPESLLALLAGAWKSGTPRVDGIDGGDALLVWDDGSRTQGVLDVASAAFRSLRVERSEGAVEAVYDGIPAPWPPRLTLTDLRSGNSIRLTLQAREPLP